MYDPSFDCFRSPEVTEKSKTKNGEVSPLPCCGLYLAALRWVLISRLRKYTSSYLAEIFDLFEENQRVIFTDKTL